MSKKNAPRKLIIFDFDGTIADTLPRAVEIVDELADEFGFRKVGKKDIPRLRGMSVREILHALGISILKAPQILLRVHHQLELEIAQLSPIPGMRQVVLQLKKKRFILVIVTSNTEKMVHAFLRKQRLDVFDCVCATGVFGKAKALRQMMKKFGVLPSDTFYVGDEVRDVEAAHKAQVQMIAVTWGLNSAEALRKKKAEFVVNNPREILSVLDV